MKFARHLDRAAIPEWRRAYIDYKKLKKDLRDVNNIGEQQTEDTTLHTTLDQDIRSLPRDHIVFFSHLSENVDRVEKFYSEREKEASCGMQQLIHQFSAASSQRPARESRNKSVRNLLAARRKLKIGFDRAPAMTLRKLRAALLELYKFMGLLQTFREQNRLAVTKVLKKYVKISGAHRLSSRFMDSVDQNSFVSSFQLDNNMKETEKLFAIHFAKGSRKDAMAELRRQQGNPMESSGTSLRTGICLGLSAPFVLLGLIQALDPSTKIIFPQYAALLQVYGACFLPVIFALLLSILLILFSSLNLIAWKKSHINYVFIFEFDPSNAIEYRQYSEMPAFLFLLLSLAFYLSFTFTWQDSVSPTTWPLCWVAFSVVFLANPFPILFRESRWWFLITLGRVLCAGLTPVEFRDFFMGDELNSLSYSFYNLGFMGCAYSMKWAPDVYHQCATNSHWRTPFLNSVPAFLRLIQCLRRYRDSNYTMRVHLVNGGKYIATIAANFAYFVWRHQGAPLTGGSFGTFVIITFLSGVYRTAWDFVMDWSFLSSHSKPKLLRSDLTFKCSHIYYYAAMLSNALVRCISLFYIPPKGISLNVRSFIFALLEVCRRIMWNLLRVENEHSRNVQAYRVIQPTALPFLQESEELELGSIPTSPMSSTTSINDQVVEGGARGRPAARDYQRRPSKQRTNGDFDEVDDYRAEDSEEFDIANAV